MQLLLLDVPSAPPTPVSAEDSVRQLNLLNDPSPNITSSISDEKTEQLLSTDKKSLKISKINFKPLTLPHFYPEVPSQKLIESPPKKKARKQKSQTKQLLLEALTSSKKQLEMQRKGNQKNQPKKRQKKTRMSRKQRREIEMNRTIELTKFIPLKSKNVVGDNQKSLDINRENQEIHTSEIKPTIRSKIPLLTESDPFPFTSLSEWLIWHRNFPELALVREAHDLDAVPQDSDEVYWINVMNEPEFFNSNWKMAGSRIQDINLARRQGPPTGTPDFDMDFSLTEGFSTLFTDIYLILTKMPNGLKNYRYPVLQLALKGLLLLDLVYLDQNIWFAKKSEDELELRVRRLDEFIEQQISEEDYEENVKMLMATNEWQKGIVCFDLLITKSIYLSTFSQTHLTENTKISNLLKNDLQQKMLSILNKVRFMDELRVNAFSAQLTG